MRVEQLRRNYDLAIKWVAFPLHPEISEDGLTLEELFPGRSAAEIEKTKLRLKEVAQGLRLPMGEREKSYNSRLAQELAKWAESQGEGDCFHEAVFRAYYVDGRNIGKIDELVRIATSVGLPEKEARTVLEQGTYKKDVDLDWACSHQLGVTAVPTFVIGERAVVGAQPYEVLEQFLKSCGVSKK